MTKNYDKNWKHSIGKPRYRLYDIKQKTNLKEELAMQKHTRKGIIKKKFAALTIGLSMILGLLAGCGVKEEKLKEATSESIGSAAVSSEDIEEKELVSLRLIMYGDTTPRREEFLQNEFHDAVLKDLNIDLTVEFLPWGSKDVLQTMLASGEKIAFNHRPDNADFIQKGYCAEIPLELIEENCPNYLEMRGNNGFECAKYEGNIYVIPFGSKSNAGRYQFFTVREDILNEVGYEAEDITTIDRFLEVCESVKKEYPNMRILSPDDTAYRLVGYELTGEVITIPYSGIYVNELEEGDKVYSWFESDAFEICSKFNAQMVEKGYDLGDRLTDSGKATADWNAGNCFAKSGVPGHVIETGFKATIPEAKISRIKLGDAPYVINEDYDWGISISTSSADDVERWLELFDWMYKDQETYDFLVYGVEGIDYERNEDGTISKLSTDVFWEDWFMMANCYQTYDSSISEENIEIYENNDENAILSKTAGFVFDTSQVSTEISLLSAAVSEYVKPISLGLVDYDENIENALAELKKAGIDKVVEEYQKQFSEWYANK